MAKQKKLQQYVFKINSTLLRKNDWNLTLPLNRARNTTGLVVALADSQILSWINELNGTEDYDIQAKYQALDAEINEYNRIVRQIHNKMSEIGQRTKTFCTIFDSEVVGYNRRLQDTISIMDSMKNMKL